MANKRKVNLTVLDNETKERLAAKKDSSKSIVDFLPDRRGKPINLEQSKCFWERHPNFPLQISIVSLIVSGIAAIAGILKLLCL